MSFSCFSLEPARFLQFANCHPKMFLLLWWILNSSGSFTRDSGLRVTKKLVRKTYHSHHLEGNSLICFKWCHLDDTAYVWGFNKPTMIIISLGMFVKFGDISAGYKCCDMIQTTSCEGVKSKMWHLLSGMNKTNQDLNCKIWLEVSGMGFGQWVLDSSGRLIVAWWS